MAAGHVSENALKSDFKLSIKSNPVLFWFSLISSVIGLKKTRATYSTNPLHNQYNSATWSLAIALVFQMKITLF